jgi:lipopolysaccharide export LptBFGC system permease protein LptF
MALAASVGVFALNESAGAPANALAQDIDDAYFSSRRATDRPGVTWANLGGGWTAHVEKFNRTALTGEGVRMHAIGPERVEEILARRIYWAPEEEAWLLEDGVRHVYEPEADRRAAGQRITQQRAPFDATPQELFAFEDRLREKRAWELARDIRRAAARNVPVTGYWVSYHERFAWPAVTAVVAVLAIPFALRLRRGGVALSFGFGVGLTITHVTLYYVFVGLGHLGVLPPMAAAWAGNVLFLAVGVVLFVKTPT